VNQILLYSSITERGIGGIYCQTDKYNLAENHCQRALSHAKRYKGVEKTNVMSQAYFVYCGLRRFQNDYKNAVAFAEDAYNCVAEAYNPVHPKVQTAAATLIECLIHKGDWYDAERYSLVTLDSLRDPANNIDQNSDEVARGYYNLAKVMNRLAVDLNKAEKLARESYRIWLQIYGNNHHHLGVSSLLLGTILSSQGNIGDETKRLFEHALAIFIRNEGPDGLNTGATNANLAEFHFDLAERQPGADAKKLHLLLSKRYFKEAVRIYTKIHGLASPHAIQYTSLLSAVTFQLSMI
jgi:tetratricopeptide (TPR) repeat protein